MLYENYKRKIQKLSDFLRWIKKHRVIIITVATVIFAFIAGILSAKGTIINDHAAAEITYGENILVNTRAFMAKTSLEYSYDGTNWVNVAPKKAGNFYVRAVSKNIVGKTYYGKAHKYQILPKATEVAVLPTSVQYGDLPQIEAQLMFNDTISCSAFEYEDEYAKNTQATPIGNFITITNSAGDDVTKSYILSLKSGDITFTNRAVTVAFDDITKTYDGNAALTGSHSISSGSLAAGDSITLDDINSITDAGTIQNTAGITIFNPDNIDVTERYDIGVQTGSIIVEKREIIIKSNNAMRVYDGKPLSLTEFSPMAETPPVNGHKLQLVDYANLTDVGIIDNQMTFMILSGSDDVTHNYTINLIAGKLEVTPREITVQADSETFVYNGMPQSAGGFRVTSAQKQVSGHTVALSGSTAITDVGDCENKLTFEVLSGEENVTKNYIIEVLSGTLQVTARPIRLKTATSTLTYNGFAQKDNTLEVVSPLGLAENHSIKVVSATTLTNVGSATNMITADIYDVGGKNVSGNYSIEYTNGILTIKKCPITLTTESKNFYYNGLPQSHAVYSFAPSLPAGQTVTIVENSIVKLTKVERLGDDFLPYLNSLSVIIYSGTEVVTPNYEITNNFGTLKMLPAQITVTTASREFIYNGQPQSVGTFTVSSGLVGGDTVEAVTAAPSLTDVQWEDGNPKEYLNEFKVSVFDEKGVNVDYNYTITYNYGTIIMKPRPVMVSTASLEKIYDGKHFDNTTAGITADNLVSGHTLSIYSYVNIGEVVRLIGNSVGSRPNEIIVKILNGSTDVSHNYEITYNYGNLKILPKEITVTTGTSSWLYDGLTHYDSRATTTPGALIDGHATIVQQDSIVVVKNVIRLPDGSVGSTTNLLAVDILEGTISRTRNYEITYVYGTLTITPRQLEVTTESMSWIYDGLTKEHVRYDVQGTIVGGEFIYQATYTTITNVIRLGDGSVGSKPNEIELFIRNIFEETDLTYNYDISYTYGKLTMNPRPITVKPSNELKYYDGTPLYCRDYFTTSYYGLAEGHFAVATFGGQQTAIGSSESTILSFRIYYGSEELTYNYDITTQTGILEVEPRYIVIYSGDANKYYDGTPLTNGYYGVYGVGLLDGHVLYARVIGSQTNVGKSENTIVTESITITENGIDVSQYYQIGYFWPGTLHVWLGQLTVQTFDAIKLYDGTPLSNPDYIVTGDLLDPGHVVSVTTTSVVYPGMYDNEAYVTIRDKDKNIVTDSYLIIDNWGTLTIIGDTDGTDISLGGGGGGGGGIGGGIGGGVVGNKDIVVFSATSTSSGYVYFKEKSFGNYLMTGWEKAPVYSGGDINAMYLAYLALANAGKPLNQITIEPAFNTLPYLVPYYAKDGYLTLDDTRIAAIGGSKYSFNYLNYIYNYKDNLSLDETGYQAFEEAYYQYVLNNYLTLPENTRTEMLKIASKYSLNAGSPAVIRDVAQLVQNHVPYSLNFSQYFGDVAVYFFTQADSALCQHYATAATAMLRALGIPARYTVGYVGEMTAGQKVDVTADKGHAWVEVYLRGIGWIQLEVTGGGVGGGGGGGIGGDGDGDGDGNGNRTIGLNIKPVDVYKVFDGTPLYAKNEIEGYDLASVGTLSYLLGMGYSYSVSVTGSQTNLGVSDSNIINFSLFDPDGENVTDQFSVKFYPGRVRIINTPIFINVFTIFKYYDGDPLSYGAKDYWIQPGSLPSGFTLLLQLSGSITDVGFLPLSVLEDFPFTVLDNNNNDVTDQYSLVFKGDPLTVYWREIEVSSASVSKSYDGTPLKNDYTWISKGFFPDGYTYTAKVTGSNVDVGNSANTIESIVIYDKNGKDVTRNFLITFAPGTLTVT